MRILVFTTDLPPLPGVATSGTALRTWGLAQGLKAHGHEIVISAPRSAVSGFYKTAAAADLPAETTALLTELKRLSFDSSNQEEILAQVNPDAILCGHWPAMTFSQKPRQPLIIDLAGPHILERHYQKSDNQPGAILAKLNALATADSFIVSGPSQRLYFLSYLLRAGVDDPVGRIAEITMPLDPTLPQFPARGQGPDSPRFVFGGVFLPWQDPSRPLLNLSAELTDRGRGRLKLIGGKHPNYDIDSPLYRELFAELAKNERVTTLPMLPYEKFIGELGSSDVAVDLMRWNLERQLAVTIRSTTYLWAGVPVIYNDFADLAGLIRKYDAGWTVDPSDAAALRGVLDEIYANPAVIAAKSANARRLAMEIFSWDRAVKPLLDLLNTGGRTNLRETDISLDFPDNADLTVTRESPIEQQFVCRVDGLTRVECRIATHERTIEKPITFRLFESKPANGTAAERRLVVEKQVDSGSIRNNEWHALDLDPIADSAGKTFVFRIDSEEPDAGRSIAPWAIKTKAYPLLELSHGSNRLPYGSLCFRTTCARMA
jgi:glycosyltransferase involved in cell wall biosynthesis